MPWRGLGAALVSLQEAERGAELLGAAAGLREWAGIRLVEDEQQDFDRPAAAAEAALGAEAFAAAWEHGKAMTPEDAIVFALEVSLTDELGSGRA
jgi:hypothetical protein